LQKGYDFVTRNERIIASETVPVKVGILSQLFGKRPRDVRQAIKDEKVVQLQK